MNSTLIAGTIIVQLALICYTLGTIILHRRKCASPSALRFLTAGVIFDITATACMITGSPNSPFTLHGILGYSSLLGMLIDTSLIWRHRIRAGEARLTHGLHLYSRLAYTWWVLAYITGAALVMSGRIKAVVVFF